MHYDTSRHRLFTTRVDISGDIYETCLVFGLMFLCDASYNKSMLCKLLEQRNLVLNEPLIRSPALIVFCRRSWSIHR